MAQPGHILDLAHIDAFQRSHTQLLQFRRSLAAHRYHIIAARLQLAAEFQANATIGSGYQYFAHALYLNR
jgi:hypothetical protein